MSRAFSPQGRRRGDDNEEKADDENGGMTKGCSRFALVLAKEPHDDERRGRRSLRMAFLNASVELERPAVVRRDNHKCRDEGGARVLIGRSL